MKQFTTVCQSIMRIYEIGDGNGPKWSLMMNGINKQSVDISEGKKMHS